MQNKMFSSIMAPSHRLIMMWIFVVLVKTMSSF